MRTASGWIATACRPVPGAGALKLIRVAPMNLLSQCGEEEHVEAIDEIVAEFLVESHENLDQLDRDLLALEQNPGSRELLASVFRTIHTIKGTSGFLAFHKLEKITHVGENLLSRLRDGRVTLTDERATQLLKMVDAVRGLLASIEATGLEGDADHSGLIERLASLLEVEPTAEEVREVVEVAEATAEAPVEAEPVAVAAVAPRRRARKTTKSAEATAGSSTAGSSTAGSPTA